MLKFSESPLDSDVRLTKHPSGNDSMIIYKTDGPLIVPENANNFQFEGVRVIIYPGEPGKEAHVKFETYYHFGQLWTVQGPRARLNFVTEDRDHFWYTDPINRTCSNHLRDYWFGTKMIAQSIIDAHTAIWVGHSDWTADYCDPTRTTPIPSLPDTWP